MTHGRAKTVYEMMSTKFDQIPFEGRWKDSFGQPQTTGIWFAWGNSGNGKTTFSLTLAQELSKFGRVYYNSLEEGNRLSLARSIQNADLDTEARDILFISESIEELAVRLRKRRSPKIVFIDSFQYADFNRKSYLEFKYEFYNKKLIVFMSHANGRKPVGRTADFARYDADVKIWIEGFRAHVTSRSFKTSPFEIWPEGAARYYGE